MRIHNVDFLRGLAAIMVLVLHASSTTLPGLEKSPLHDVFWFGKYGVEIFFVISGYIITYSLYHSNYTTKNIFKFLAKRLIRINPPAYFIMIAFLLIEFLTWSITGNYLILENPFNCLLITSNFLFSSNVFEVDYYVITFWTLEIEMQFYLLIAIIFPLLIGKSNIVRYTVLIGITLLGISNFSIAITGFTTCFLLGIVLFLLQAQLLNKLWFFLFCIFCSAIFIVHGEFGQLIFSFISLWIIQFSRPLKSSIFQFLGKISYSLYIMHVFMFTYLDVLLNGFGLEHFHESIQTKALIIIVYSGIAIIASAVFYNYVEKPFINYSKRINWNLKT